MSSADMSAAIESLSHLRDEVGRRRSADTTGAVASKLDAMHREGLAAFDERGLPSRRDERWKGTSIAPLEATRFGRIGAAESADATDALDSPGPSADLLVVDGRVVSLAGSGTSWPQGVRISSLADLGDEDDAALGHLGHLGRLAESKVDALVGLQSALFEDVAIIALDADVHLDRAIRIRSTATAGDQIASASFPRLLVIAGRNARASVVLEHVAQPNASGFTSLVAEFVVEDGAHIEAIELQAEDAPRIHLTQTFAEVGRDAHFDSRVFSLGDGLTRSELSVRLRDTGAATKMDGFFLGRNDAHIDHFTTVDHEAPHGTSDEEYRGVLAHASHGVFRGRVIVRPDAQKTDARQSNPNLLLSDRATIDTKPQLEIYADDVKASHGATIGQLDADALFFLRARGIGESEARLLLTRGFAQSMVDDIEDEATSEWIGARVEEALTSLGTTSATRPGGDVG